MKIFTIFLILIFNFQSFTKADDIKEFEIEGMSVGTSLLEYAQLNEIINESDTPYDSKKFSQYVDHFPPSSDFDGYIVHYKTSDKNFIIMALEGVIVYKDNISECYQMKKKIVADLKKTFNNSKTTSWQRSHVADKTGKSKTDATQFDFKEGGHSRVTCNDWSENMNYTDKLTVSIITKEFERWIQDEAYAN